MFGSWKVRDGEKRGPDGAFQFERLAVKLTPWRVIFTAVGVAAYALGLIAMLPAEAVAGKDSKAVGTVWKGETPLNGFAVGWAVDPFDSIARFAGSADLTLRGPDTTLEGEITRGFGRTVLTDLDGAVSARLLKAPGLPFECDSIVRVRLERFTLSGRPEGQGTLASAPGSCAAGGVVQPVPALTGVASADATGSILSVTPATGGAPVMRARVTPEGRLALALEQAAVGVVPGVASPATIETDL